MRELKEGDNYHKSAPGCDLVFVTSCQSVLACQTERPCLAESTELIISE